MLLTLLGAGGVTAGAAYAQGDGSPASSPTSHVAAGGAHDDDRPGGDRGAGHRDGVRPTDDHDAPGAGS